MKIYEFKKYIDGTNAKRFVVRDFSNDGTSVIDMEFNSMLIFSNPNTICLKCNNGLYQISCVDEVTVEKCEDGVQEIAVKCNGRETEYKLSMVG